MAFQVCTLCWEIQVAFRTNICIALLKKKKVEKFSYRDEYESISEGAAFLSTFLVQPPYHAPPQGIGVAGEARLALLIHSVFLRQVDEVGGEDQAQEADVQGRDQLLENKTKDDVVKMPRERFYAYEEYT